MDIEIPKFSECQTGIHQIHTQISVQSLTSYILCGFMVENFIVPSIRTLVRNCQQHVLLKNREELLPYFKQLCRSAIYIFYP